LGWPYHPIRPTSGGMAPIPAISSRADAWLIVALALGLRLFRIADYTAFQGDQGIDALAAKRLLVDHIVPLEGPATSSGGVHLGPFYYYLLATPMLVDWLDPLADAVIMAGFGAAAAGLVYVLTREWFGRVPALVAVHQDYSGHALADALAYAKAFGSTRAGVLLTTFAEETETDLFGEQAVLCGGTAALVKAGFETLVEAGYQPEVAYFECLHELKLIVDLLYQGGLNYMRHSISDTAEHGDYHAGGRIVTAQTKAAMRDLLAAVRDGSFARDWIAENRAGRPTFEARRAAESEHQIETVGRAIRRMMPFLDAKEVLPGVRGAERETLVPT